MKQYRAEDLDAARQRVQAALAMAQNCRRVRDDELGDLVADIASELSMAEQRLRWAREGA